MGEYPPLTPISVIFECDIAKIFPQVEKLENRYFQK
jgi:hypothetical protein